jgi:DNA-directed RNA polymerase subunit RPC12/RpoP
MSLTQEELMFKCQECGKKIPFSAISIDTNGDWEPECPRCGSTDIDLDES